MPQLTVVQPDGKILVGGGFDFINGTLAGKVQRLNPDGSTDPGFNPGGAGANGFVSALLRQPDGKILIGGGFTAYNATPVLTVARLNANGTLDPSFAPTSVMARRQIGTLALQADGKILVGGGSNLDTNQNDGQVFRLNADGSRDASFDVGTGVSTAGGFVRKILVQADGKILVGGTFATFNGQAVGNLVRLNNDGSLDGTFAIGTGATTTLANATATVRDFAQQADGKVVVGGEFSAFNGQPAPRLVRVLANGIVDASFAVGAGPNNTVYSVLLQTNGGATLTGGVVLGGVFTQVDGQVRNRVARVLAGGALDATFGTGTGASGAVASLTEVGTGQFLAAGSFLQYEGAARTGLVRLTATGATEPAFSTTAQPRGSLSAAPLANGQIMVGGFYSELNGTATGSNSTRRLNADGSLDQSYTTSGGITGLQPDGSFLVISSIGGNQYTFQRTLPSGALDNSFAPLPFLVPVGSVASPLLAVRQPDGQFVAFGNFYSVGGMARNGMARFNANGVLDATFVPPTSTVARAVTAVVIQASGKLVITYQEPATGPVSTVGLARLNADGSLDNTFAIGAGAGPNSFVSLLQQPDGKILLGGGFASFNGQATPFGLARLNIDGSLDNTFNAIAGTYTLRAVQADGRILATTGSGAAFAVVRLNTNGSLDNSFAPVVIPLGIFAGDDFFGGISIQPADNKILVYGSFRTVAGQTRIGLARLTNPVATATRAVRALLPLGVYPNPTSRYLRVELPLLAGPATAALLDLAGRTVGHWPLPTGHPTTVLDLNVAPGLYVLRIPGAAGVYQQKVVVTR